MFFINFVELFCDWSVFVASEHLMSRIQLREDAHIIDLTRSKVTVGGLIETKIMCTPQEKVCQPF